MIPKTGTEMLRAAADVMEQRGHAKGILIVTDEATATRRGFQLGSVCALGAICVAAGVPVDEHGNFSYGGLSRETWKALGDAQLMLQSEIGGLTFGSIPAWNNNPDRPGTEVIAVMRKTADKYTKTLT